jgi:hypothetical protein
MENVSYREPSKLKLCVISPFPEKGDTYPQVACLAKWLRQHSDVNWVTIWERGFRLDQLIDNTLLARDLPALWRAAARIVADWRAVSRAQEQCDVLLAIDFMALVLGSAASKKPMVLWSHDFIPNDEDRHARKINQLWLSAVTRALRGAKGLIVQDADRCSALMASVGTELGPLKPYYLPVSLPSAAIKGANRAATARPRLMQIGGLNAWRSYTDFLLEQFAAHPDRFELMLHGIVGHDVAPWLERLKASVMLDEGFVESDLIPDVVAQCDIGFVGYRPTNQNFFAIKNASGQLVEFMRCGKPVLSMGTNDLGKRLEDEGAGRAVSNATEFFEAINSIQSDYSRFSANAKRLFEKRYNFEHYAPTLLSYLEGMCRAPPLDNIDGDVRFGSGR